MNQMMMQEEIERLTARNELNQRAIKRLSENIVFDAKRIKALEAERDSALRLVYKLLLLLEAGSGEDSPEYQHGLTEVGDFHNEKIKAGSSIPLHIDLKIGTDEYGRILGDTPLIKD